MLSNKQAFAVRSLMHRSEPEFVGGPENAETRLGGNRSTTINVGRCISGVRAENDRVPKWCYGGKMDKMASKMASKMAFCPRVHAHLAGGGKPVPAGARPLGLPHRFNLAYNP
jgi:hypothetical protein